MLGCIIEIENKLQKSLYIVYNNKQIRDDRKIDNYFNKIFYKRLYINKEKGKTYVAAGNDRAR